MFPLQLERNSGQLELQEPLPYGRSIRPASISNPLAAETNICEAHSKFQMGALLEGNQNWLAHLEHLMVKLTQPNECKTLFIGTTEVENLVHLPTGCGLHTALISSGSAFFCVCFIFKEKIKYKHTYHKLSKFTDLPVCTIWYRFRHSLGLCGFPSLRELLWELLPQECQSQQDSAMLWWKWMD